MTRGDRYQGMLTVGQRVYAAAGGRCGIIVEIHGEQKPHTIQQIGGGIMVAGGNASMDVVWDDGSTSKRVPESIVRGIGWHVSDEIVSPGEVAQSLINAESEKKRREDEEKRKAEERRRLTEELPKQYPHLETTGKSTKSSHALGAANLRKELKAAFPGVKFRVKSESYSGGDNIDVGWTDGPTKKQVDAIADRYQECDFDGMTDSTSYRNNVFTRLFGGAKYVFCNRNITPELTIKAANEAGYTLTADNFDQWGNLRVDNNTDDHWIRQAVNEYDATT